MRLAPQGKHDSRQWVHVKVVYITTTIDFWELKPAIGECFTMHSHKGSMDCVSAQKGDSAVSSITASIGRNTARILSIGKFGDSDKIRRKNGEV